MPARDHASVYKLSVLIKSGSQMGPMHSIPAAKHGFNLKTPKNLLVDHEPANL
jgi:hypothetical protein